MADATDLVEERLGTLETWLADEPRDRLLLDKREEYLGLLEELELLQKKLRKTAKLLLQESNEKTLVKLAKKEEQYSHEIEDLVSYVQADSMFEEATMEPSDLLGQPLEALIEQPGMEGSSQTLNCSLSDMPYFPPRSSGGSGGGNGSGSNMNYHNSRGRLALNNNDDSEYDDLHPITEEPSLNHGSVASLTASMASLATEKPDYDPITLKKKLKKIERMIRDEKDAKKVRKLKKKREEYQQALASCGGINDVDDNYHNNTSSEDGDLSLDRSLDLDSIDKSLYSQAESSCDTLDLLADSTVSLVSSTHLQSNSGHNSAGKSSDKKKTNKYDAKTLKKKMKKVKKLIAAAEDEHEREQYLQKHDEYEQALEDLQSSKQQQHPMEVTSVEMPPIHQSNRTVTTAASSTSTVAEGGMNDEEKERFKLLQQKLQKAKKLIKSAKDQADTRRVKKLEMKQEQYMAELEDLKQRYPQQHSQVNDDAIEPDRNHLHTTSAYEEGQRPTSTTGTNSVNNTTTSAASDLAEKLQQQNDDGVSRSNPPREAKLVRKKLKKLDEMIEKLVVEIGVGVEDTKTYKKLLEKRNDYLLELDRDPILAAGRADHGNHLIERTNDVGRDLILAAPPAFDSTPREETKAVQSFGAKEVDQEDDNAEGHTNSALKRDQSRIEKKLAGVEEMIETIVQRDGYEVAKISSVYQSLLQKRRKYMDRLEEIFEVWSNERCESSEGDFRFLDAEDDARSAGHEEVNLDHLRIVDSSAPGFAADEVHQGSRSYQPSNRYTFVKRRLGEIDKMLRFLFDQHGDYARELSDFSKTMSKRDKFLEELASYEQWTSDFHEFELPGMNDQHYLMPTIATAKNDSGSEEGNTYSSTDTASQTTPSARQEESQAQERTTPHVGTPEIIDSTQASLEDRHCPSFRVHSTKRYIRLKRMLENLDEKIDAVEMDDSADASKRKAMLAEKRAEYIDELQSYDSWAQDFHQFQSTTNPRSGTMTSDNRMRCNVAMDLDASISLYFGNDATEPSASLMSLEVDHAFDVHQAEDRFSLVQRKLAKAEKMILDLIVKGPAGEESKKYKKLLKKRQQYIDELESLEHSLSKHDSGQLYRFSDGASDSNGSQEAADATRTSPVPDECNDTTLLFHEPAEAEEIGNYGTEDNEMAFACIERMDGVCSSESLSPVNEEKSEHESSSSSSEESGLIEAVCESFDEESIDSNFEDNCDTYESLMDKSSESDNDISEEDDDGYESNSGSSSEEDDGGKHGDESTLHAGSTSKSRWCADDRKNENLGVVKPLTTIPENLQASTAETVEGSTNRLKGGDEETFDDSCRDMTLEEILTAQGINPVISAHDGGSMTGDHVSILSPGAESYIHDLVGQKERREKEREQDVLEDAFEMYHQSIAKGAPQSDALFLLLLEQVQKDKATEFEQQDRLLEERLDAAILFPKDATSPQKSETAKAQQRTRESAIWERGQPRKYHEDDANKILLEEARRLMAKDTALSGHPTKQK